MATAEASLRIVTGSDGITYVAVDDMAALLLDTAVTLDGVEITASDAMRSMSSGLAKYSAAR